MIGQKNSDFALRYLKEEDCASPRPTLEARLAGASITTQLPARLRDYFWEERAKIRLPRKSAAMAQNYGECLSMAAMFSFSIEG